jgi:hypothetical protein
MQLKGYIGCNSHHFHMLQCNIDVRSAYTQDALASFRSWFPQGSGGSSPLFGILNAKDVGRSTLSVFFPMPRGGICGVAQGLRWVCGAGLLHEPTRRISHLERGTHSMAWLEKQPTAGRLKISFRWGGRKLKKTSTSKSEEESGASRRSVVGVRLWAMGRNRLEPGRRFDGARRHQWPRDYGPSPGQRA